MIRGLGQDRHFFRVAVYGLEKGFIPETDPEDVSPKYLYLWSMERSLIWIGREDRGESGPYWTSSQTSFLPYVFVFDSLMLGGWWVGYTEENGYIINTELKEELDWIAASISAA